MVHMLKKAAESCRNGRLNSDNEQEEEAEGADSGSGSGSRGERAGARPQPTLHNERPL